MNTKSIFNLYALLLTIILLGGCKDSWEEHLASSPGTGTSTLLEKIAAKPSLSRFYEYLKKSGLDSSLASSKTYTVWAPDNQAIEALLSVSPEYLSDPATIKSFVAYHIATLAHPLLKGQPALRVLTLTGLSVTTDAAHYEEAGIREGNELAKNGILNILDVALKVKTSVFEAAIGLAAGKQQGLAMSAMDTTGVDANGIPTIKRSAGWASLVTRMSAPDSLYTYFILNDAAYSSELTKISPYYRSAKTRPDSTESALTKIAMLENSLVRGLYTPDQLPDTLRSVGGVKMTVKKSAIVSSYKANNGMVYVVNELPIALKDRVREFKIEGEQTVGTSFSRTDRDGNTYYRTKVDSLGIKFNDIEVYDQRVPDFYVQYQKAPVLTATYNVYARAVSNTIGDLQTVAFTQRYGVPNPLVPIVTQIVFTHVVAPMRYSEVYLGQYTVTQHGTITWRLISAVSNTANVNTLILDYLRFVPVLPQ